jgi:thiol-disulfide isomerase/thioredoxin
MKIPRIALLTLLLAAGCREVRYGADTEFPAQSMYVGTVDLPEGLSVPLQMSLDFSGSKFSGYFLVGDEKTPIPEISKTGDTITLGFSEYSAQIKATWNGTGLSGTYDRIRSDGTKSLPFKASPTGNPAPPPRLSGPVPKGNYQVLFQGEEKVDNTTSAKFWDKNGVLQGTFIAPDGDYGLLVGQPSGKGVQFSRFTGWQAIALVMEPQGNEWSGKFYAASNSKPRSFILQPRADAPPELVDTTLTVMKNASKPFAFSGLSLSGETVRDTDARFKGKALIVDIMGTWCHNCLDEAPVLQKLQQEFGKDGLEVVGLSFEISDDPALAKKNLQLFKDRFGITYTLLFCGSLDDENVKKQIHSQLDNFFAYPTAIFMDKNHKVQTIHSGFKGPGTGDEFQAQIREFQTLAKKLVE